MFSFDFLFYLFIFSSLFLWLGHRCHRPSLSEPPPGNDERNRAQRWPSQFHGSQQRRDAQSVSQSVYEHPIYRELKEVFFFLDSTGDKLSLSRAVWLRSGVNDERVAQKLLKVSPHFITYKISFDLSRLFPAGIWSGRDEPFAVAA